MTDAKEDKTGYKKTRLSWIPQEWDVRPLIHYFTFLSTYSLTRNDLTYEITADSIFYIHYGDIHATYKKNVLDFEIENRIPVLLPGIKINGNVICLKNGDLIIADASEDYEGVGACIEIKNLEGRKAISGLHTIAIRDKNGDTASGFRPYIFENKYVSVALKRIATGSKVYGISKTNLQSLEIILPSLPEQQKITQILTTWDNAIEKTEQLIAKKQERKKGLMQQLLTGKRRFKEYVKSEKMQKTKLGWIHEDWEDVKLCLLFRLSSGKSKPREVSEIQNNLFSYPVYGGNGIMAYSKDFYEEGYKIIIGRVGEYCGVTSIIEGKYWITDNALFTSEIFKDFDFHFLTYKLQYEKLSKLRNKGGQPLISQKPIYGKHISLPPLPEQQKIGSVLSSADKEIEILRKQLAKLKEQKRGLMQKLLTGEVRVQINETY